MSLVIFYIGQKAFVDHENIELKALRKLHFCKGVNPWFWSKI